ncbi:NIPA-like protein 2 [Ostrea edulis]|uniref:NIPA-like protein 2 n=1 Tax=Ostrea edulis TaxID=37623 RepID=UPI002095864A|nr:NIPA-like protein 2 [Ostrea edulis]
MMELEVHDNIEVSTNASAEALSSTRYQDILVGCLLAVGGNLLISVSLNIQKYSHMKNAENPVSVHYTRDPLWWTGILLMGLGEIGNFSAYGFSPASLIAPLGTTTVVANMFLAALFLKEKIKAEHLFGSALAVIGAFLLIAFSAKNERVLNGDEINQALIQLPFVIYICVELVGLGVLFFLLYYKAMTKVVIYLLISSVVASFTVIAAKAVSSMLQITFAGIPQFSYPILYIMLVVMIVTAITQIKYLNEAMKSFDATVVVPTNFVFFTISAITAGIVFYKEFWGMNVLEIFMFFIGCFLSFIGVYFITLGKMSANSGEEVREPSSSTEYAQQISPGIFPSWLMATVNVGEVQPKGEVTHLSDSDREPFFQSKTGAESFTSQDTMYSSASSPVQTVGAQSNYGATEH